jgi:hypothetical protein
VPLNHSSHPSHNGLALFPPLLIVEVTNKEKKIYEAIDMNQNSKKRKEEKETKDLCLMCLNVLS